MFNFGQSTSNQQPNAFGSSSTNPFGANTQQSTGLFGQPQQPQQQQQQQQQGQAGNQSTPFGGFGSTSTPFGAQANASTPFGGFGSAGQAGTQQANSFGFGSSQQTTPGFGSGSGGMLGGQTAQGSSAFGSQQQASGGGLFGSSSQPTSTGAFGSGSVFGQGTNTNAAAITTGTANPPFAVTSEKEGTGTGMNHFQSITCMPAYAGLSFEELRVQDYAQGRRYGSGPQASGFGSSFGQSTGQTSGLFGQPAPNAFGQTPANNFGSQPSQPGLFGSAPTSQTNTFGQTQPTTNAFGAQTTPAQSSGLFGSTGGGLFGSTGTTPNTGFGNTPAQQPQQPSIFGQQNPSTSIFGSTQAGASPFGLGNQGAASNSAQKPFSFGGSSGGGFGTTAPTNTSGGFGTANTGQSTGLFGQPAPQQNTASGGLFGQQQNTAASNTSGGTGFNFGGATAAAPAPAFSFGGTTQQGANNAAKPGMFGNQPASSSSGLGFGQQTAQSAAKPTFSFGSTPAGSNAPSGSNLFGSSNNNTTTGTSGSGLFGNAAGSSFAGGLFGNSNAQQPQQQPQQQGASFFNKPAFSGGSGGGIFGNTQPNTGTAPSLFGTPAPAGSNTSNTFGGNSLFGQSTSQQQVAQQPSISNSVYGNNPLFTSVQTGPSSTSPGPLATPLVANTLKKKPATLPRFNLVPRSATSSPRLLGNARQPFQSPGVTPKKTSLSLFDEDLLMNPDAFSPRSNLKKLVIDRKADDLDLLSGGLDLKGARDGPPTDAEPNKMRIEPARTSVPTRISDGAHNASQPPQQHIDGDEAKPAQVNDNINDNAPPKSPHNVSLTESTPASKSFDAYWTSPGLATLMDMSKAELSKVRDFTVGRRGYGQVRFCQPVDLSSLEQVEDVVGKIIIFEPKMCTVYPDEHMKPAAGKGLNVPAIITLEQCYPLSKDKRQPIRDKTHPRFQQHVDRLQRMSETEFVDYLADSGTWVFKVAHF